MDYKHHMMTRKCIRTHAMTHYRKLILKEMKMSHPHDSSCVDSQHTSYVCYICGVRDATSSYIINHLGVYHKRLDFYNEFGAKMKSVAVTKERGIADSPKLYSSDEIQNVKTYHHDDSSQSVSENSNQVL